MLAQENGGGERKWRGSQQVLFEHSAAAILFPSYVTFWYTLQYGKHWKWIEPIKMADVKIGKLIRNLSDSWIAKVLLVPSATESLVTVCTLAGGCCG